MCSIVASCGKTTARTMCKIYFLCFLVVIRFTKISSKCTDGYVTTCDNFEDLKNYKNFETMKFLHIGSEFGNSKATKVNLLSELSFVRYYKLTYLAIIGVINKLESNQARCTYSKMPLKYLSLYGNNISNIDINHFPILSLKSLSLTNNNIEVIRFGALVMQKIEDLDLSDNLLETIVEYSLPSNEETKYLSVKNNKLTHVEANSLPLSLISLKLDGNQLRYLENDVLSKLINLTELTLSRNKFRKIPELKHNRNLLVFDISSNEILSIKTGAFESLDKLKYLDLSNNQIGSPSVLEWLLIPNKQNAMIISLALNFLTDIILENVILEQQKFVLYGNPLNCSSWADLKTKLDGHESECDKEFQSSGKAPYCINYFIEHSYDIYNNSWGSDAGRLREAVIKSQEELTCRLDTTKNDIMYFNSIILSCVL